MCRTHFPTGDLQSVFYFHKLLTQNRPSVPWNKYPVSCCCCCIIYHWCAVWTCMPRSTIGKESDVYSWKATAWGRNRSTHQCKSYKEPPFLKSCCHNYELLCTSYCFTHTRCSRFHHLIYSTFLWFTTDGSILSRGYRSGYCDQLPLALLQWCKSHTVIVQDGAAGGNGQQPPCMDQSHPHAPEAQVRWWWWVKCGWAMDN